MRQEGKPFYPKWQAVNSFFLQWERLFALFLQGSCCAPKVWVYSQLTALPLPFSQPCLQMMLPWCIAMQTGGKYLQGSVSLCLALRNASRHLLILFVSNKNCYLCKILGHRPWSFTIQFQYIYYLSDRWTGFPQGSIKPWRFGLILIKIKFSTGLKWCRIRQYSLGNII